MLVTVSSVRGAPGTTSWALMLGLAWPHPEDRVLVEADPVGGVLGPRYDVPLQPGVASLLSATRAGRFEPSFELSSAASLLRPGDGDSGGLWVAPGLMAADEALAAWRAVAAPAAAAMSRDTRLWLVDCGRPWPGSPVEALTAAAALNLVVTDGSLGSLVALRSRLAVLGRVGLLVVGDLDYPLDEVTAYAGTPFVWTLPWADDLAGLAGQLVGPRRRARQTKPWRRAIEVAHELAATLPAMNGAPVAAPAVDGRRA